MTGKKYKPALFELLGKGPMKPNERGAFWAPKWLSKKPPVSSGVVRKEAAVVNTTAPAGVAVATPPVRPVIRPLVPPTVAPVRRDPVVVAPAASAGSVASAMESRKLSLGNAGRSGFQAIDKKLRLQMAVPYWALVVAALGVVLVLLLMYRWGQSSVRSAVIKEPVAARATHEAASPAATHKESFVERAAVREPEAAPVKETAAAESKPAEAAVAATPMVAAEAVTAGPASGLCLIMCGHEKEQELKAVQEYFNSNGIPTTIGRFQNRYVLYSEKTVKSQAEGEATQLSKRVAELGAKYNSSRPAGAPSFTAETFATAYWAKVANVKGDKE